MDNFIKTLITEAVWAKIRKEFTSYVEEHYASLNTEKEQEAFTKLLMNDDEYTTQVLNRLWSDFEVEACSEERIQELFDEELAFFNKIMKEE